MLQNDQLLALIRKQSRKEIFVSIEQRPHARAPGRGIEHRLHLGPPCRRVDFDGEINLISPLDGWQEVCPIRRWHRRAQGVRRDDGGRCLAEGRGCVDGIHAIQPQWSGRKPLAGAWGSVTDKDVGSGASGRDVGEWQAAPLSCSVPDVDLRKHQEVY